MHDLREQYASDKFLSHYTTQQVFLEYILPSNTIKMGRLGNVNDPREAAVPFIEKAVSVGLVSEKFVDENEIRQKLASKIRLFCATRFENGLPPYEHPRMWSQYAENTRGVCLGFDMERLIAETKKAYEWKPAHFQVFEMVYYSQGYRSSSSTFVIPRGAEAIHEFQDESSLDDPKFLENCFESLSKKHIDWAHESEFRLVGAIDCAEDIYVDIRSSLRYIISDTPIFIVVV